MKLHRTIILCSVGVCLLFGAAILVFIMGHIQTKAEIRVEADPESDIYVNGKLLGVSPQTYESTDMKPTLKIIPHANQSDYLPYVTALSLTPQTKTIVRRNFGSAVSNATTQILSFKKIAENVAPMTIVTNPESAYIFINNEYVGTSPLRIERAASTYSVQIMRTGFQALQLSLKNTDGYDLTAFLDLAAQSSVIASTTPNNTGSEGESPTVTILKTPTGYLRVHESPSESSSEIARALVGREYLFKSYSPLNTWVEINLNASESGWILGKYATVSGELTQ